jgi:hypothetical protein
MNLNMQNSFYGVKIGYDCLDDDFFKTTTYKFFTYELAKQFKTRVEQTYDQFIFVIPIGEIKLMYPEEVDHDLPTNCVARPIYSCVQLAMLDLEDLVLNINNGYMYLHEIQDEELSMLDDIILENKITRLKDENKRLLRITGTLKMCVVIESVLLGVLFVSFVTRGNNG